MSMPKYLSKGDAPISIVVRIELLMKYLFKITNNEKQFGKAYRYTLNTDIRNTCLKLHKTAYKAVAKKPRFKEEFDKRKKRQQKMFDLFIDLKALLVISADVANIANLEYLSKLYDEALDAFNKWVKNDQRLAKRAPTEKEYREAKRRRTERRNRLKAEWASFPRDDEGFVILGRKDVSDNTNVIRILHH